jgi:hypothetical protein
MPRLRRTGILILNVDIKPLIVIKKLGGRIVDAVFGRFWRDGGIGWRSKDLGRL